MSWRDDERDAYRKRDGMAGRAMRRGTRKGLKAVGGALIGAALGGPVGATIGGVLGASMSNLGKDAAGDIVKASTREYED